ncbi:MAG TPA: hypothetical protein VKT82_26200, partial [Ktedonobacterales bacterium]|nr:hypothetical protein [Ktedonobacterales bacterium]
MSAAPQRKHRTFLTVTEGHYAAAEEALALVAAYKARHRKDCPTLTEALLAMVKIAAKVDEGGRRQRGGAL